MAIINNKYYSGYKPLLSRNNYVYYVDDTNRDIMYELVCEQVNKGSRIQHIQRQLDIFNILIRDSPILVYFSQKTVRYESIKDDDITTSYAERNRYVILKLVHEPLISIE